MHTADTIAQSARMGWMPFYPQFDANPLDVADEARGGRRRGRRRRRGGVRRRALQDGTLKLGDRGRRRPGELAAHARALALQPVRLLGQGQRVLPARTCSARTPTSSAARTPTPRGRPTSTWHDDPPEGKLDLLVSADFRMTSTTLLSDVVLPAATWYEKHDLSLDRHAPVRARVHPGDRPAVGGARPTSRRFHADRASGSPTSRRPTSACARTWSACRCSTTPRARRPSRAGGRRLARDGTPAMPGRPCRSSRSSSATTPRSPTSSPRVGPLADTLGFTVKNVTYRLEEQVERLGRKNGVMLGGAGDGRPAIDTDEKMAEAILTFSGTTNGAPRGAGLPDARGARRQEAARPRRGLGGEADHLRRHPGGAGAGDHLAGVVGLRDRRTALRAVHRQHRAAQAVPHPHRPDALLPRPRLDAPTSARRCRSIGHRWTCIGSSASRRSARTAPSRSRCAT